MSEPGNRFPPPLADALAETPADTTPAGIAARVMAWMHAHERALLLAAAAFQVLVLAAMVALRVIPLVTGETVRVRVQPVDPRDLFRGDYVILAYEFSRVPASGIGGLWQENDYGNYRERQGRPVYLTLVPGADGLHQPGVYSVTPPSSGLYLRGRLTGYNQIEYGIEAYYLEEGTGLAFEDAIRERKVTAELAVTRGGTAVLRGLVIE